MKGRPPLCLDIQLVNGPNSPFGGITPFGHGFNLSPSPSSSTYRLEGLSIGHDYMRFEGATLSSSLSPSALEIECTIGMGACSVVKRARHVKSGETLALKIFPVRGDADRKKMLEKELRTLCTLDCECLVGLVGAFFGMHEGTITLVLEYMDRGSLVDILKGPSHIPHTGSSSPNSANSLTLSPTSSTSSSRVVLPERCVASIAYQMLWGIAYLHYENMLHRDIKPANVLVNSDGVLKLSDFGIASKLQDGEEMNCTVIGTTRYMSPERLRAKPYGAPSDIWSLGLVLLEASIGRSPFEDISSMVELVLTVEETSVEELVPSYLSSGLREILAACLQQEPGKRVPASILIASPWFLENGIDDLNCAADALREYLEMEMPHVHDASVAQDSLGLSKSASTFES